MKDELNIYIFKEHTLTDPFNKVILREINIKAVYNLIASLNPIVKTRKYKLLLDFKTLL